MRRPRRMLEQEIKLAYPDLEAARLAVTTAGGRLETSLRLLDDRLFDTADLTLRNAGCALRLRRDDTRTFLTFKGRVQPGRVKTREEHETSAGSADVLQTILHSLGYQQVFRAQKMREEYALAGAHIAIDHTPMGTFVEIEGVPDTIAAATDALGRTKSDYILDSYPSLFRQWCDARGLPPQDMLLDARV